MLKKDDIKLDYSDKDEYTHLYTLILRPDNTYEVLVDNKQRSKGSLGDGQWSKFAPIEIDDPSDVKPADWEENAQIPDPAAEKPADWDEDAPKTIADPDAAKPSDWDEEEDGAWEAPQIPNPKHKGKWARPVIPNPKYRGVWKPKQIPNPAYDPNAYAYKDIGAVGFELWVVNSGSIYSNIIVTDSVEEAQKLASETFAPHVEAEKDAKKAFDEKNKPKEEAKADAHHDHDHDDDDDAEDKDEL